MSTLPDVSSRYGAPMGRVETTPTSPETTPVKLYLHRIRLNSGGYDGGGAYWGHGQPLYAASDDAGQVDQYLRATSRDAAKAKLVELFPLATFYR